MSNYILNPNEIEKRSFEIIESILGKNLENVDSVKANVIKRVVHTTGNTEIYDKLVFSNNFFEKFCECIKTKTIYTDVNMIKSGLSKNIIKDLNIHCFINDEDIVKKASEKGVSRAFLSMEKALNMQSGIFVIGNAPTALFKLLESKKNLFIIGVPVGFVGAAESKEELINSENDFVSLRGTMGGSTIATAIFNSLIREL